MECGEGTRTAPHGRGPGDTSPAWQAAEEEARRAEEEARREAEAYRAAEERRQAKEEAAARATMEEKRKVPGMAPDDAVQWPEFVVGA